MSQKQVSVSWVLIYIGWALAFAVWAASWIFDIGQLGELAILIVASASTATVREFFIEHDEAVRNIVTVLRLGEVDGEKDSSHVRLRPMR